MSKLEQLSKITSRINKEAKKVNPDSPDVAFIAAGNEDMLDFGLMPTGNPAIDAALGGGIPRGNIIQWVGDEGTGKTCAAMDMIAYNQKIAKEKGEEFITIYVHFEASAFPLLPALNAGVDLDSLLIVNALDSAEKTFDILLRYMWDWEKRKPQNLVDLVVIDSITAAAPEAELKSSEESLANNTIGRHAAMMSKFMRDFMGPGALGRAVFLLINQYRTNVGGYGDPRVVTGGKSMGYFPKITLAISKPAKGVLKRGKGAEEETYGHTVEGKVVKNNTQVGKPHVTFSYPVIYGQGVDPVMPVIDIAIRKGILKQLSSAYWDITYKEEYIKFHGKSSIETRAREDAAFFQYLQDRVVGAIEEVTEENAPLPDGVVEAFDGLAEYALKEYEAGNTRDIREFAEENGIELSEDIGDTYEPI